MTRLVLLTAALLLAAAPVALAESFSGSLTSENDGLLGTGLWVVNPYAPGAPPALLDQPLTTGGEPLGLEQPACDWEPATLSWQVIRNLDGSWHYTYDLDVWQGGISHFLLETSQNFTCDDIFNAEGDFCGVYVDWWGDEGNSNPNIPGLIYGIKFDNMWGTEGHIEFDSDRAPVWGDFYAKDGKVGGTWNAVWNAGFTGPDWDPTVAPSNGSVFNHILVPDTTNGAPIPEPGTLALLGLGVAGLGARLRRRARPRGAK